MSYHETWQDLKVRFEQTLQDEKENTWLAVWQLFVGHPWYQHKLNRGAIQAIAESGAPIGWRGDVEHEAALLLCRSLRNAPDLRMNQSEAEEHFPGWIAAIIRHDCLQAIRRLRVSNDRTIELQQENLLAVRQDDIEARIDLSIAIEKLDSPDKEVLMLRATGMTITEIAATVNLGYSKTYRILQRAITSVKDSLG